MAEDKEDGTIKALGELVKTLVEALQPKEEEDAEEDALEETDSGGTVHCSVSSFTAPTTPKRPPSRLRAPRASASALRAWAHLCCTEEALKQLRADCRAALLGPQDGRRVVVVAGPCGSGKSAAVRAIIQQLGYPELAAELAAESQSGRETGSSRALTDGMYHLRRHATVLVECDSYTFGLDVSHSVATAADLLLVLLPDPGSGSIHGCELRANLLALAWRLRSYARTVFLYSKVDLLLSRLAETPCSKEQAENSVREALVSHLAAHLLRLPARAERQRVTLVPEVQLLLKNASPGTLREWLSNNGCLGSFASYTEADLKKKGGRSLHSQMHQADLKALEALVRNTDGGGAPLDLEELPSELREVTDKQFCGMALRLINGTDTYEGAWDGGRMHGFGAYTWEDGSSYTGQWAHGTADGMGARTWVRGSAAQPVTPNGWRVDSYTGGWREGEMRGMALVSLSKTDKHGDEIQMTYRGTWEGAGRHGFGKSTSGDFTHVGHYRDDCTTGQGRMDYPDGDVYVGALHRSKRQGLGVLLPKKAGREKWGTWEEDRLVSERSRK